MDMSDECDMPTDQLASLNQLDYFAELWISEDLTCTPMLDYCHHHWRCRKLSTSKLYTTLVHT